MLQEGRWLRQGFRRREGGCSVRWGSRPEKVTFEQILETFITARSGAIWAVATGSEHHHQCGVSWEAECHMVPSQECLLGWGFLPR